MMRKRFAFLGVLALVLVLVFPTRANAIDFMPKGVFYQGDVGNGNYGAVVAAYNQYDAACYVLGKNPDSISATIKQKLSDPNYGGRFYEYAQSFFTQSGALEDVPAWVPTYIVWGSELMDLVLTDYQSVWYSTATKTLHDDALVDLVRILNGEDVGGGSDGSISMWSDVATSANDGNSTNSNVLNSYNTAYSATFSDGNLVLGSGSMRFNTYINSSYYLSSSRVYVSPFVANLANDFLSQGYEVVFVSWDGHVGFAVGHGFSLSYDSYADGSKRFVLHGSSSFNYYSYSVTPYYDSEGVFFVFPNDSSYTLVSNKSSETFGYYSSVFDTPVVTPPSGTWPEPETPTTPDPPEVPTPTAPTDVPDPTPTEPTVVWPTAPIVVNPPEVTVEVTPSGLDYTQLLTEINDNLLSIDSYTKAINSSLNSLRSDLVSGFDDVVSAIRNVYQYLQHFDSILEVHCKHIRDSIDQNVYELELYLKQLFEWLPQQLSFDAEFNYDDSAVTSLLYRILNKIPGGSNGTPTSYMPNPQADEPGFFDWLLDLWHRFLIDLVSVLPDELGGLVDAFSQLTHYFPFSIPWDLAALLALFEHEPVTPVFDIPWGFGGDEGQVQNIRIDLSCWDGVMAMVRPVFLVGFCFKLALITKDLLSGFDISKGGV